MYTKNHGKGFLKSLTRGARKVYKGAASKVRRQQDKRLVKE